MFLQRSLDCISQTIWRVGDAPRGGKGEFVLLTAQSPLRFKSELGDLFFTASQNFHLEKDRRFRREWKVRTDRYEYQLSLSDTMKSELIAWHWHPGSRVTVPHLHAPVLHESGTLSNLHVPTGRVSFEEVCRFLIYDLGIEPRRSDYEAVLSDSDKRFKKWQSWR